MTETNEHEQFIAIAWIEGFYTEEQAQFSCEKQGVSFKNVKEHYGNLYHAQEAESSGVEV